MTLCHCACPSRCPVFAPDADDPDEFSFQCVIGSVVDLAEQKQLMMRNGISADTADAYIKLSEQTYALIEEHAVEMEGSPNLASPCMIFAEQPTTDLPTGWGIYAPGDGSSARAKLEAGRWTLWSKKPPSGLPSSIYVARAVLMHLASLHLTEFNGQRVKMEAAHMC